MLYVQAQEGCMFSVFEDFSSIQKIYSKVKHRFVCSWAFLDIYTFGRLRIVEKYAPLFF